MQKQDRQSKKAWATHISTRLSELCLFAFCLLYLQVFFSSFEQSSGQFQIELARNSLRTLGLLLLATFSTRVGAAIGRRQALGSRLYKFAALFIAPWY